MTYVKYKDYWVTVTLRVRAPNAWTAEDEVMGELKHAAEFEEQNITLDEVREVKE